MLQESRIQNEPIQTLRDSRPNVMLPESTRHHQLYDCPVYVWYASGWIRFKKAQPQRRWFVYIEYRDRTRASQYHLSEFDTPTCALDFMDNEAIHLALPDICPKQTRTYPIVKSTTLK
ncbi:hypothetical protein [Endozoicomonas sp. 4G]|uniref:hypothetical protein n=1 Tax=Endozoicomonas sp. 4G TaxID=2872754 RepID=UPI00207859A9|nr:hypothetical protein [Endozoicomonas sp. 4G]